MRKFPEIIERIEYIRSHLGLNKSRFSAEIGMKPQTYNNFIGSQGSKPNVELIYGIVSRFAVNPVWLFTGSGAMFLDSRGTTGPSGSRPPGVSMTIPGGQDGGSGIVDELRRELSNLEPLLRKVESEIKRIEGSNASLLDRVVSIIGKYLEIDPVNAGEEVKQLLERIEQRLAQHQDPQEEGQDGEE